ncbi:peptidoglycan DD-metalloendopeptidase family protein [Salinivibrio sp. ES.052]|uniref:peptidoglycan DD-metalloendopeptidase family protein n=1 Tax=Salinivibrio sp. ES.052 TaxID=1882823 RepID=UPI0009288123|nr:peptidoglycan DD-metalloendopeptidase family protein [Salinivibrio sp. ES.052]SIO19142.1 Septal ring factor EnvC, activator of murein hydrolases AmiA and AmiB [Salinivibrio sp. ES.052]
MREIRTRLAQTLRASALCTGVFLCLLVSPVHANSELEGVSDEIARQQSQLAAHNKKLDALQSDLKAQSKRIDALSKRIRQAQRTLKHTDTKIARLTQKQARLKQEVIAQQARLGELLDAQYRQGEHDQLKRLLSQESPTKLDRLTKYAEVLASTMQEAIESLAATRTDYQLTAHQLKQQRNKQASLVAELTDKKRDLEREQTSQSQTAKKIRTKIASDSAYLAELKANKQRLQEQIAAAARRAQVNMAGIGHAKGKLGWPTPGKLLHRFGERQSGEVTWNGIVISAKRGTEVKAAHAGKVVLSSWLRGYGLLIAVDHGKGDMTLYGYNQALLKEVGDTVTAGEPIALVGDSGGQSQPSLYFEIRRKGNTTNPIPWLD